MMGPPLLNKETPEVASIGAGLKPKLRNDIIIFPALMT